MRGDVLQRASRRGNVAPVSPAVSQGARKGVLGSAVQDLLMDHGQCQASTV